jgi:hypothetical protein
MLLACEGKALELWDTENGKRISVLGQHGGVLESAAQSPGGKRFVNANDVGHFNGIGDEKVVRRLCEVLGLGKTPGTAGKEARTPSSRAGKTLSTGRTRVRSDGRTSRRMRRLRIGFPFSPYGNELSPLGLGATSATGISESRVRAVHDP